MTFHLLHSRRTTSSLERSLNKGGGGAPSPSAPIPPVTEKGSEIQYAREDAMRAGLRKKGNRSTILAGATDTQSEAASAKGFGQRTLLGSAAN